MLGYSWLPLSREDADHDICKTGSFTTLDSLGLRNVGLGGEEAAVAQLI